MRTRSSSPDAAVESRRAVVAEAWRRIRRSIRAETGLSVRSPAWGAGLAGLAIGLELARRWGGRSRAGRESSG